MPLSAHRRTLRRKVGTAFSDYSTIQWIAPIVLLIGGMSYVVSGFILSIECPTCGTLQLLLGVGPCLAGGYHAYTLESRAYISHGEARQQTIFAICLYVTSMLYCSFILRLMEQGRFLLG
jgi:hypothetical protein